MIKSYFSRITRFFSGFSCVLCGVALGVRNLLFALVFFAIAFLLDFLSFLLEYSVEP